MILIVDCGSTKAEWVVLENKNVVEMCVTNGFNPNFNELNLLTGIIHDCINKVMNVNQLQVCFITEAAVGMM